MTTYNINSLPTALVIGRQTETGVTDIRIDCAPWLAIWPELDLSIWVTPPGGAAAYPAATHQEGDILVWDVNSGDTAVEGRGSMEVMGVAEGLKKLSSITATQVLRTTTGVTGEPPEPAQMWIDEVLAARAGAAASESKAALHAETAMGHAQAAQEVLNSIPAGYAALAAQVERNRADILTKAPVLCVDVSGALVAVKDAEACPVQSLVSEIKPTAEGVSAVTLTRTGRNMVSHLDYIITQYHVATVITEDWIDVVTPSGYDYGKIPVKLKGGATYTLVIDWEVYGRAEDATDVTTCSYRIDKLQSTATQVRVSQNTTRRMVKVYTATEDVEANILWYPNFGGPVRASSRSRVMLLEGAYTAETAPAFEPGVKQTLTASLPETICGGTLDWTSGLLTITHGADGAEMAEPVTHQIDPKTVEMRNGHNTLLSDTGDTAVSYIADTKLYIDGKFAELQNAILAQGANI